MILFALVLNLIALIINLVLVSITLANPACIGDILPTVIFLLSINILTGIAMLIYSDKPWEDL